MSVKKTVKSRKPVKAGIPAIKDLRRDYRTRIIVRFTDNISLPYKTEVARSIKDMNVGPWDKLEKQYPGILIEPLFKDIDPDFLRKLINKAKEMDPDYREGKFFSYYRVVCPAGSDPGSIRDDLSAWEHIRNTYIQKPSGAPAVDCSDDLYAHEDTINPANPYQRYLNDAPEGVSSKYVWNPPLAGSDGFVDGLNFIDIEKGWDLAHEDLVAHAPSCLYGTPDTAAAATEHGTAVLGIVCASDNDKGCVGIVPNLKSVNVISTQDSVGTTNVAGAILASLQFLGFGDVLLIQATNTEEYSGADCQVPIETAGIGAEFDAIRLATALGIVVIEPGGNGDGNNVQVNLDDFEKDFAQILRPPTETNPNTDFKESGAIIVTAAESAVTNTSGADCHRKMPWAPYGARVDCFGWGENITTLGVTLPDPYVHNFGGTSGAAAMIAGAVLSMQGMVMSEHGYKMSPGQVRHVLRNSAYGTRMSRNIGGSTYQLEPVYMPDLHKFANQHLNLPPDLYMRDSPSDTGLPHSGAVSWSPDIILKNSQVPDPTAAFGDASPDRNNDNLSDSAVIGVDNYLYFRALNQGGSVATGAKAVVFYSNPSTLITPSSLIYIGEVDFPDIPVGNVLTVSGELPWNVPGPVGHYCFVAFVTCAEDPYFDPKTIKDDNWTWSMFYHFIQYNNNVTWRNFNMVGMTKSSSSPAPEPEPEPQPEPEPEPAPGQVPDDKIPDKGWIHVDFVSPGLPETDKKMHLEIISKLPKKAMVILRMPYSWKRDVFRGSPYIRINRKKRTSYRLAAPHSNTRIENILFKAGSKTRLRLYMYIPEKLRNRKYLIAVRQILDGKEVGRVTWQLVPQINKPLKPKQPGRMKN